MNERIRELALEAKQWANSIPEFWDTSVDRDMLFQKKFAELIVKECAGVCDDERDSTDSDFGKLVAEGCALKIMERFGVEE